MKKKLLLLGGSAAQTIAIETAKRLGYYTVLCDYLPDNPGQYIADSFYLVSTTDKKAVLEVARKEKICGIVAYSSDPAAPTAAYVSGKLGIPGMDYDIARSFCEKDLFREFLQKNGFHVPRSLRIHKGNKLKESDLDGFGYPLIIKPTDSSGSKGISVVREPGQITSAFSYAEEFSRNGNIIIEEFIERDHPYVIEAEIFTVNGKVATWGLINSIRDDASNPLLPAAYSYPLDLPEGRKRLVREEVSRLVSCCGNVTGAFNIEMIINREDKLFFLDAGPRNGGNMLPEFISMIARKDIVEATIKAAMGDMEGVDVSLDGESGGYWGLGVLHTAKSGRFSGIEYSADAKRCLKREEIQRKIGDVIRPFERCNDLVGLTFFQFTNLDEMNLVMCGMNDAMKVITE